MEAINGKNWMLAKGRVSKGDVINITLEMLYIIQIVIRVVTMVSLVK